jgi:hypothetical protein
MIDPKKEFDNSREWLSRRKPLLERGRGLQYLPDLEFTTICYPVFLLKNTDISPNENRMQPSRIMLQFKEVILWKLNHSEMC